MWGLFDRNGFTRRYIILLEATSELTDGPGKETPALTNKEMILPYLAESPTGNSLCDASPGDGCLTTARSPRPLSGPRVLNVRITLVVHNTGAWRRYGKCERYVPAECLLSHREGFSGRYCLHGGAVVLRQTTRIIPETHAPVVGGGWIQFTRAEPMRVVCQVDSPPVETRNQRGWVECSRGPCTGQPVKVITSNSAIVARTRACCRWNR